jgi:hypothetical protein
VEGRLTVSGERTMIINTFLFVIFEGCQENILLVVSSRVVKSENDSDDTSTQKKVFCLNDALETHLRDKISFFTPLSTMLQRMKSTLSSIEQ